MVVIIDSPKIALESFDRVLLNHLRLSKVDCPTAIISPKMGKTESYCYFSDKEPEELLKPFSIEADNLGKVEMPWRLDIGKWVTTYNFKGNKVSILMSFTSTGSSSLLYNDPKLDGVKTVGKLIIEDMR